jgi:hypothetical protein
MPQSLHSFCKTHQLSKTTVYRWLTDRGYDLSQGLSDAAIEAATTEFVEPQDNLDGEMPTAPTVVLPDSYGDPFAGMSPKCGETLTPYAFQATDRTLATAAAAQRVQQLCMGAHLHAQQTVQVALKGGNQMGQQLGAFLAEQTIAAAEQQRQALIQQYLQAQGVDICPKPEAPSDGHTA